MFRVDLHVHTKRYSPCAELLNPDKLAMQARKRGLHGVVITEHDQLWTLEDLQELQVKATDIRFYRGVEVSSASGHFVVIGLNNLDGITRGISVEALTKIVKSQKATLILVHHHLVYSNIAAPIAAENMPQEIDAIEVASTITFGQNQRDAEKIAKKRGWTAVAGSDAHNIERLGATYTSFQSLPKNEKQLAQAIKSGACIAERLN
jgi:predicted metal-dependent phosphoesterase TrpH